MKLILTILISLSGALASSAQNFYSKPLSNGYHLKFFLGHGTHFLYGASLHHVNKKGFSLAAQYVVESRDAENLPDDYRPAAFPFSTSPRISITTTNFLIGKVFESNQSNLIHLDVRGGLSYGFIKRPVSFQRRISGSYLFDLGSNYTNQWDRKEIISLIFNPSLNFNLTRVIGLSLGARANINHQDIAFGFEGGVILGYLRGKKKIK